jgi:hypothetical protein
MTTFPDFLIIGAQKAGTTWLHRNLRLHPGIWMPEVKEVHYFDEKVHVKGGPLQRLRGDKPEDIRWRRQAKAQLKNYPEKLSVGRLKWDIRYFLVPPGDGWYAALFRPGLGKIVGEATPDYAVLDGAAIARAHGLMPDAKIIFMMRSPVERAWSSTAMTFRLLGRDMQTMTDRELDLRLAGRRVRQFTDYLKTLESWGKFYPPEQVFVGFLEDIHFQPVGFMHRLYEFLGADTSVKYRVVRRRVHTGSSESMPLRSAAYLAHAYRGEMEQLDKRFGGYASFWLYCADRLANDPPPGASIPYPLWESSLWRDWVEGPGSFVKTAPGRDWLQSGPLSRVLAREQG